MTHAGLSNVRKSGAHTTAFKRFDEAGANRNFNLRWLPEHAEEAVAAD